MACIVCGKRIGKSPSNRLKEMFCSSLCSHEWQTLTHFVKVSWPLPRYTYQKTSNPANIARLKTYFIS